MARAMDPFLQFNFVLLDGSASPTQAASLKQTGPRSERVDVIARQLRQQLDEGDPADTAPHALSLTYDFKLRREVHGDAAWLAFMLDIGDGRTEKLEEVAFMVLVRADADRAWAGTKLSPYADIATLPAAPLAIAVMRAKYVPPIISEWFTKAAAGFFSQE
jgi:hypothetical protein